MKKILDDFGSKALAEAIGTFGIVFVGCGSLRMGADPFLVPVMFGSIVTAMVYATGHISGAHLNPAVTLGFAIVKRLPWNQVRTYWLSQFIGALAAITLLSLLIPNGESYGATIPAIDFMRAVVWEVVLTFFLMFVIMAVATDNRAVGMMGGLVVGITVMLNAYLGGGATGASMNPARSFAPALAEGNLSFIWIYFVGPCIGAAIGALSYEAIRNEVSDEVCTQDAEGIC